MKCEQVPRSFNQFMAGECTPFEEKKITDHLAHCQACQLQLEQLKKVSQLLDSLEIIAPPKEMISDIMKDIEQITVEENKKFKKSYIAGLSRDLSIAAAMALVAFGFVSSWLTPLVSIAENNIYGAAFSYVSFSDSAIRKAQGSLSEMNSELFLKKETFDFTKITKGSDFR